MKKEPPMGSVLIDAKGSAWQRHPVGWNISGGDGSWSYTWKQLLKELHLPMNQGATEKWAPVLTDPRIPCIIYIPNQKQINEKSNE